MAGPLSYNGAAFLFSGLSQAGQSLGSGIGQGLGRFFDEKALKKLVDDLRKSMGGNAPGAIVPNNGDPQMFIPPIEGFQDGGYTGPGAPSEPAGIVHRNEYVVPSDQVQDAGGPQMIEALLSGLSRNPRAASAPGFAGIANLAQMWEKRKEEEKAIGTTGKALKQIFKSNPDLLQGAGLMPEQLDNLGHRDVIGLFEGMQQAQAMQAKAAGMKELAARLLQQQQAAAQQQAISQDFARFATALPGAQRDAQATAPELGAYYESTSDEMPEPPDVAGASQPRALAALAAKYPMALESSGFRYLADMARGQESGLALGQTVKFPDGTMAYGTGGAPHLRFPSNAADPKLFAANDPTTGQPIPGMALTANGAPVQTGERGGLKDLSQTELQQIAALEQAGKDMDRIEELFKGMSDASTGPVVGRTRALNPYDEGRAILEQAVNAAVPNLARGVFREVGVLTDEDVKRYAKQFPTITDPPDTRRKKLEQLRKRIGEGSKTTMEELRKAGRDITGFEKSSPAPAEGPLRYQSEEQARKGGAKKGDVIELYLPERGGYVKVKLK